MSATSATGPRPSACPPSTAALPISSASPRPMARAACRSASSPRRIRLVPRDPRDERQDRLSFDTRASPSSTPSSPSTGPVGGGHAAVAQRRQFAAESSASDGYYTCVFQLEQQRVERVDARHAPLGHTDRVRVPDAAPAGEEEEDADHRHGPVSVLVRLTIGTTPPSSQQQLQLQQQGVRFPPTTGRRVSPPRPPRWGHTRAARLVTVEGHNFLPYDSLGCRSARPRPSPPAQWVSS